MRCLLVLAALCFIYVLTCITASPIDPNRRIVRRPILPNIFREGLEPGEVIPGVKGHTLRDYEVPAVKRHRLGDAEAPGIKRGPVHEVIPGVKGHPRESERRHLAKGEYYCGDKICRLKPGEIPEGCNELCQYRI